MHSQQIPMHLILVLCGMQSVCLGCGWIQHQYGRLNGELLSLLTTMGGNFTEEVVPVPFPSFFYSEMENASMEDKITFLNETINKIKELFVKKLEAVTWDKRKLDDFQNVLHSQSRGLLHCVSTGRKYENRLKPYFRKLHNKILKEKNYSTQAWELIRKEVRQHLRMLYYIYTSIKSQTVKNTSKL